MAWGAGSLLSFSPQPQEAVARGPPPPLPVAQYGGWGSKGSAPTGQPRGFLREEQPPGPPTSYRHEVSGALGFVGGERADGGEDDEGEGEEQDLVEMGAGSPHPSPSPEHTRLIGRETEAQKTGARVSWGSGPAVLLLTLTSPTGPSAKADKPLGAGGSGLTAMQVPV